MYHVDDFISLTKTDDGQYWIFRGLREVFGVTGPDDPDCFCGTNIVITDKLLVLHGIPWIKARLKEYGLLNSDGSVKKELTLTVPWKGEASWTRSH